MRKLIGVVGGLGPLASTRFLSTIYRQFRDVPEQETPRIVLYSDPTFPDRTTAFLRGEEEEILAQAVRTTESLLSLGVDHLLFCCYTIHRIAPRLPAHVLERFVSLLDLAVDAGLESQGKILLLCTNGTRKLRLFEGARKWGQLADRVSFPSDTEQPKVHEILYDLKKNCDPVEAFERLSRLLRGHEVDHWLLACTELHLLSNVRAGDRHADFTPKLLDPLQRAADMIRDDSLYRATYSG